MYYNAYNYVVYGMYTIATEYVIEMGTSNAALHATEITSLLELPFWVK